MNSNISIFTINYLPPVQYLAHWFATKQPFIEKHDSYLKRTYRNRCDILAANGPISLTIPVIKSTTVKPKTKDIEISYDTKWQAMHWRSIVSAYGSSPFFEYYLDDFKPFYEKNYRFLFDYNLQLLEVIFNALDTEADFSFTKEYMRELKDDVQDVRTIIHPKKNFEDFDKQFKSLKYRQVFSDRFPFTPNLSVIDLIFNKGPEAIDILEDSIN